jgi:hypothetical protein
MSDESSTLTLVGIGTLKKRMFFAASASTD